MVLKWLPVSTNQAINGEAPELGDSPIKSGEMMMKADDGGSLSVHIMRAARNIVCSCSRINPTLP